MIMKKVFVFAAAVAALASCAKNEVALTPAAEKSEISYNVAPRTKGLSDTQSDFDKANVFASWAYYLPKGKNWDANSADAQDYIVNSTISYQAGTNTWKETGKSYYWPKDGGSLTFFAYSLNKANLDLVDSAAPDPVTTCGFTCTADGGIQGMINLDVNKNTDFLVADIAKDKTASVKTYSYNGVPTLFRHRLSRVACTVAKAENYQNKKFELTSINFLKVSHFGTYAQLPTESIAAGTTLADENYTDDTQLITTTATAVDKENIVIYMPQSFADNTDAKIEVKYTITTTVGDNEVKEECTFTKSLKDIFPNNWEMGKKYTVNLTFSLNEITWDPAVEDWTTANSDITVL